MTTIAARASSAGVWIAADRRVSSGNGTIGAPVRKLYKVGNGVVGLCGPFGTVRAVLDALGPKFGPVNSGDVADLAKAILRVSEDFPSDGLEALFAVPDDGVFELDSRGAVLEVASSGVAIGSGAKFALGALSACRALDARVAVEAALEAATSLDVWSGDGVDLYLVRPTWGATHKNCEAELVVDGSPRSPHIAIRVQAPERPGDVVVRRPAERTGGEPGEVAFERSSSSDPELEAQRPEPGDPATSGSGDPDGAGSPRSEPALAGGEVSRIVSATAPLEGPRSAVGKLWDEASPCPETVVLDPGLAKDSVEATRVAFAGFPDDRAPVDLEAEADEPLDWTGEGLDPDLVAEWRRASVRRDNALRTFLEEPTLEFGFLVYVRGRATPAGDLLERFARAGVEPPVLFEKCEVRAEDLEELEIEEERLRLDPASVARNVSSLTPGSVTRKNEVDPVGETLEGVDPIVSAEGRPRGPFLGTEGAPGDPEGALARAPAGEVLATPAEENEAGRGEAAQRVGVLLAGESLAANLRREYFLARVRTSLGGTGAFVLRRMNVFEVEGRVRLGLRRPLRRAPEPR